MKRTIFTSLLIISSSLSALACSCVTAWNDSFSRTAKNSEFVALVRVISFDSYIENSEGKIPYSMTVEVIKKYKGQEQRKKIEIYGDNGILCRPYLSNFEINGYYLIAPKPIDDTPDTAYDFFACSTDYLLVDFKENRAFGNYSFFRRQIDLSTIESKMKYGDWDFEIFVVAVLVSLVLWKKKRRNKHLTRTKHISV